MKLLKLVGCLILAIGLAACSTTQEIKGASNAGYVKFAAKNGSNIYVCPPPQCGTKPIVVAHKAKSLSASEKAEMALLASPKGPEYARRQLSLIASARGNNNVSFRRGSVQKIGRYTMTIVPMNGKNGNADGSIGVLASGNTAQLFIAVATNRSGAQKAVVKFATLWAQNQR